MQDAELNADADREIVNPLDADAVVPERLVNDNVGFPWL